MSFQGVYFCCSFEDCFSHSNEASGIATNKKSFSLPRRVSNVMMLAVGIMTRKFIPVHIQMVNDGFMIMPTKIILHVISTNTTN